LFRCLINATMRGTLILVLRLCSKDFETGLVILVLVLSRSFEAYLVTVLSPFWWRLSA
jgi:hypothetical protein